MKLDLLLLCAPSFLVQIGSVILNGAQIAVITDLIKNTLTRRLKKNFVISFLTMAALTALAELAYITLSFTLFRTESEFSIVSYISRLGLVTIYLYSIWFGAALSKKIGARAVLLWLLQVNAFIAFMGLIQLVVFQLIAYNLFPIPRADGEFTEAAFIYGPSELFFRINSIALEPKNLATNLSIVIASILEAYRISILRMSVAVVVSLAFCTAGLVLTWSTSGIIILGMYCIYAAVVSLRDFRSTRSVVVIMVLFLLGSSPTMQAVIDLRVTSRLGTIYGIEDFDLAAVRFLQENPISLLIGTGFTNLTYVADSYLEGGAVFAVDTEWAPKSGALYIVSTVGILGLGAFVALVVGGTGRAHAGKGMLVFMALIFLARLNILAPFVAGIFLHTASPNRKFSAANDALKERA